MKTKYLGKIFEGYEVVNYRLINNYKGKYKNDKLNTRHNTYRYTLYNKQAGIKINLSGNCLREIYNGKRTIKDMLNSDAKRCKNFQIYLIRKSNRLCQQ